MEEGSSYNTLLKISHVFLGGISLILVATSYVPFFALDTFLIAVASCFTFSTTYLIVYLILPNHIRQNYGLRLVSSVIHTFAALVLIIAGIELIGWSEYDTKCGVKCPRMYYIGVAKILTFINGTFYGIHGFLEISKGVRRDEDSLRGESVPLLSASQEATIIPTPMEPSTSYSAPFVNVVVIPPSDEDNFPNYSQNNQRIINS